MTQEITMLLAVLLFLFVLTAIQVMMTMKQYGNLSALAGRDDIPHLQPGLGGRLHRAIVNLKEGLHIFAPLVLLTAILGVSNDYTVRGAQIYLVARLLHAPYVSIWNTWPSHNSLCYWRTPVVFTGLGPIERTVVLREFGAGKRSRQKIIEENYRGRNIV